MNLDFTYYNPTRVHFGKTALEDFIKELGIAFSLRELGATEDMLPKIAESTVQGGGYKKMNADDILQVLKAAY